MNEITTETYYKVLKDGRACHGGTFDYQDYLPKGKRPGKWLPAIERVAPCVSGYHACEAKNLAEWLYNGNEIYVVEFREAPLSDHSKVVGSQMRFVRKVEHGETIADVTLLTRDITEVAKGTVLAFGSATVEASGSATVRAYDSATVRAFGSATVRAFGSATVEAFGSATVEAFDSATVEAFDSATVRAFGSATVRAFGSATVRAFGSATVRAFDSATVEAFDSATVEAFDSATVRAFDSATVLKPKCYATRGEVKVEGEAVLIDRSQGGIKVYSAVPVEVVQP